MFTSVNQDKCSIDDANRQSKAIVDYTMQLSMVGQQAKGPIPLVNGRQNNVSVGPLRNLELENQLQRNSNALLSKCDSYQQQQLNQSVGGVQLTKPWEAFSAQPVDKPLLQFQRVDHMQPQVTKTSRVENQDHFDMVAQQVFANMPWQARVGRGTTEQERPLDFSVGQQDTYLITMQQLENQNRKEMNEKRQREATLRAYYRANPQPISTPYA